MKLTDEERTALEQSIDHWQNDIINKFVGGNIIKWLVNGFGHHKFWWVNSKENAKIHGDSCPLCIMFNRNCHTCCPYYKYYGNSCDNCLDGHWYKFSRNLTKENAIAMRDALQAILDSDKENKCKILYQMRLYWQE